MLYEKVKKSPDHGVSLAIQGQINNDPKIVAEHFNEFFLNIPTNIVSSINPSPSSPTACIPNNLNSFSLTNIPVTPDEILEAVESLNNKKTSDLNGISSNLLKKIAPNIVVPLHHIFMLSFKTGVVPSQLNIAKVVPIFKSGDRNVSDNYRPISLLNSFSKILEKIVSKRLTTFFNSHNLFSNSQFGFRAAHSTSHPMLHLLDKVSEALNKNMYTIAIFCDLKKAFDTCNHDILLSKLERYGVRGTELTWFSSYLKNRQQYVEIGGERSQLGEVKMGVPQGSILGPLLFLIYINDLPDSSKLVSLLFADDTTLLYSHDDLQTLTQIINTEFQKICNFFRSNGLVLHPSKTNFILFTTKRVDQKIEIFCNNNNLDQNCPTLISPIEQVTVESKMPAIKYLGVYFDPNLNFKFHLSSLSNKLSRALYALRLAKNFLSSNSLIMLYFALFHCHLNYANLIWSTADSSSINKIFKMQKNAIRIIHGANYNAHTEPIFKKLEILPLPDLITFAQLQFMHRYVNNMLPSSFSGKWEYAGNRNIGINNMQLRHNKDLIVPFARIALTAKMPHSNLPKIWNLFRENELKTEKSPTRFDTELKKFFLNDLATNIRCDRLYCPACSRPDN